MKMRPDASVNDGEFRVYRETSSARKWSVTPVLRGHRLRQKIVRTSPVA
jgi:hypothetical protein